MKKAFANDNVLKVISVVVAIVIWLYIIIVLDPYVEVNVRDLPIQFVGEEQLNANGLSVVNESATTLSLKVKGSRKKMGNNDMKTIIAKVDVSGIQEEGTASLPVEVVVPFENAGISSQNHYNVDVKVEKLVEKQLNLEVTTKGTLAENYMAGPIKTDPETITIKGPESVVGKIAKAGVILDYANADVDIDEEVPIILYGTDGKELPALDAILQRIQQDATSTKIHCAVVKLREVKVVPQFEPVVQSDGTVANPTFQCSVNPETVQIYGEDQLTAKITEIQTEPISVEKFLDNQKVKVKLSVPEGVKILRDISEAEVTLQQDSTQSEG